MKTLQDLYITTDQKNKYFNVCLYYDVGGVEYFNCKEKQRGIYISITPVTKIDLNGYEVIQRGAYTGYKVLLKALTRYSDRAVKSVLTCDTLNTIDDVIKQLQSDTNTTADPVSYNQFKVNFINSNN